MRSSLIFYLFLLLLPGKGFAEGEGEEGKPPPPSSYDEQELNDMLDSVIEELIQEPEEFWHPYLPGNGNDNREQLKVTDVTRLGYPGTVIQWKYARLGLKHYLVALKKREIVIMDTNFTSLTSLAAEDSSDFETLTVFTKWNEALNRPEMVIITASSEPRLSLHLFLQGDDSGGGSGSVGNLTTISSFLLPYLVKSLEFCHVGQSSKVVLVPLQEEDQGEESDFDIDIYNIEPHNTTHTWFFQRLPAKGNGGVVVFDSDMLDSVVGVAVGNVLNIYVFDQAKGMFMISQEVRLPSPCRSLFSFTVAYQNHVGCVPQDPEETVRFVSFNYNENEYQLDRGEEEAFKGTKTEGVYSIAVPEYTEQYLTLAKGVDGAIRILVYHGEQEGFKEQHRCMELACPDVSDLSKGVGFRYKDTSVFVFPNPNLNTDGVAWKISKEMQNSRSPLADNSLRLYKTYDELSSKFEAWQRNVLEIEKALNSSLKPDGANKITGSWDVNEIRSESLEGSQKSKNFEPEPTNGDGIFFVGSPWTDEDFQVDLRDLETKLTGFNKSLGQAEADMKHAIFTDVEEVQYVSAHQKMNGELRTSGGRLKTKKLTTASFNVGKRTVTPAEYLGQFLHNSDDIKVQGVIQFEETTHVAHLNTSTLSKVKVEDIARYDEENVFQCPVQMTSGFKIYGSVVTPTINGINLKEEGMPLNNISGVNFLQGFVVKNNTVSKDPYHTFDNVVLKSSSSYQVIRSHVQFEKVIFKNSFDLEDISGTNFQEFAASVVTPEYKGVISGQKVVQGEVTGQTLYIHKTWNGVPFPDGFVRNRQHKVVLKKGSYQIKNLTATTVSMAGPLSTLHGKNVEDYVTKNGVQEVKGIWTLTGPVEVVKDIHVGGLVDGVNMKELANKATLNDVRDPTIYSDVELEEPAEFVGTLSVLKNINGQGFDELFGDLLIFNGSKCEIPGVTEVETLVLDDVEVQGPVNSQKFEDFLLRNTNQELNGTLRFKEPAKFKSLQIVGSYNDVDLKNLLENAIHLEGSNSIGWNASFEYLKCETMKIQGSINGITEDDLQNNYAVTKGRVKQRLEGGVAFKEAIFEQATILNDFDLQDGQLLSGGVDIKKWYAEKLSLSSDETIHQPLKIKGGLKVSQDIVITTLNSVPLEDLKTNTFRSKGEGGGAVVFTKPVTLDGGLAVGYGSLNFRGLLNDKYDLNEISQGAFPLNGEEEINLGGPEGSWEFEKIVVDQALSVGGAVCGVDLPYLNSSIVRKDQGVVRFQGPIKFADLTVKHSVKTESLNNHKVEDILTTSTDQNIQCPFVATKNLQVKGNLKTEEGMINGLDTALFGSYQKSRHNVHTLHLPKGSSGPIILTQNITVDKLTVKGKIQDRDFSRDAHNQQLIRQGDKSLKIQGSKVFSGPIIIKGPSNITSYNDFDTQSLEGILYLDEDLTLEREVTFGEGVTVTTPKLLTKTEASDIDVKEVNGINWEEMKGNAIIIDEPVDPDDIRYLTFDRVLIKGDVKTTKFQGHEIKEFIHLDGSNGDIEGDLNVGKVKITGDKVDVKGLFGGINVEDEYSRTIRKEEIEELGQDGTLTLAGSKAFNGTITVTGDSDTEEEGLTCFGPSLKDNVINIQDPYISIPTSVVFKDPLTIRGNLTVEGPIQGHTIPQILEDALTLQGNQSVKGSWEFQNRLTFKDNVYGDGKLKNFDIQNLKDKAELEVRSTGEKIESRKQKFKEECQRVHGVTGGLLYNPMKLDAFDKHQTIPLKYGSVDKMVVIQAQNETLLLLSEGQCNVQIYQWDHISEQFYGNINNNDSSSPSSLNLGDVNAWDSSGDGGLLVFSTGSVPCSPLKAGLYLTVSGDWTVKSLLQGDILSFRVISEKEQTAVFALQGNLLVILVWSSHTNSFTKIEEEISTTTGEYETLDVTQEDTSNGSVILLTGPGGVAVYEFTWRHPHTLTKLGGEEGVPIPTGISNAKVWVNFGLVHVLVPYGRSGRLSSMVLYEVVDGHLLPLQSLLYADQTTIINFSQQIFICTLSPSFGLTIYKFQGLSGLQPLNKNPIKLFSGKEITTFDIKAWDFSAPRPFISVLTRDTIEIYHSKVFGDSLDYRTVNMCQVDNEE